MIRGLPFLIWYMIWGVAERNCLFAKYVVILVTNSTEYQKIVAETVPQLSFSMSHRVQTHVYVTLCSLAIMVFSLVLGCAWHDRHGSLTCAISVS